MRPRGNYVDARAIVVHDSQISTPCAALEAKWCFAHETSGAGERKRKSGQLMVLKASVTAVDGYLALIISPVPKGV